MPPTAPMPGRMMLRGLASSPSRSSRFSSRPMRKKKMAIRPSLIQSSSGLERRNSPRPTINGRLRNSEYSFSRGELAIIRARTVASISRIPPAASKRRKRLMKLSCATFISTSSFLEFAAGSCVTRPAQVVFLAPAIGAWPEHACLRPCRFRRRFPCPSRSQSSPPG